MAGLVAACMLPCAKRREVRRGKGKVYRFRCVYLFRRGRERSDERILWQRCGAERKGKEGKVNNIRRVYIWKESKVMGTPLLLPCLPM